MMTSDDVMRAAVSGREYAVISGRLEAIEEDNRAIHAELRDVNNKLDLLLLRMDGMNERIDDMKFYMSLRLGALAVFVAAVTLVPIVQALIQALRKPDNEEKVRGIVREEIARLKVTE